MEGEEEPRGRRGRRVGGGGMYLRLGKERLDVSWRDWAEVCTVRAVSSAWLAGLVGWVCHDDRPPN